MSLITGGKENSPCVFENTVHPHNCAQGDPSLCCRVAGHWATPDTGNQFWVLLATKVDPAGPEVIFTARGRDCVFQVINQL